MKQIKETLETFIYRYYILGPQKNVNCDKNQKLIYFKNSLKTLKKRKL